MSDVNKNIDEMVDEVIALSKRSDADIYYAAAHAAIAALVGDEHVDKWWASSNKAFDGQSPSDVWKTDKERVLNYIMSNVYGDYS